jgi:protein required for attachment to host cells
MSTWVLVAHRTGARLFEHKGHELSVLKNIDHPAGRIEDHDLETGPQRNFDSHAQGRHAADRGDSRHERAAVHFARDLAKLLEEGRLTKGVERIVLVAEPHFLGLLRAELGGNVGELVTASVPKDLHAVSAPDVLRHLDGVLPGTTP